MSSYRYSCSGNIRPWWYWVSNIGLWWRGQVDMSIRLDESTYASVDVVVELQYANVMSALSSVVQPPTHATLTITADN